jgi:phage-related protein
MANYTSEYSFMIDGVSSDDFGIFVETLDPVPHAKQRYTQGYTGSEEPYAIPDEVFEPIKYTIRFFKFFPDDLDDSALRYFLYKGEALQLSTMPYVYFRILTISTSQISQTADNRRINYAVTFTLRPFRYGLPNNWQAVIPSGSTILNRGTWNAKPIFELTEPSGDITITINDEDYLLERLSITERDPSNKIYVDSMKFVIYQGQTLINYAGSGRMPILVPGNNAVSVSGTVETVRIRTYWRCI